MTEVNARKKPPRVWRKAFLLVLSETGNISVAAEAAEISRTTAYNLKWKDPEFAAEWKVAEALGVAALEDELLRRAKDGVKEPVFYKGEAVGYVRKFSDTLGIFLLKAKKPDTYRERWHIQQEGKLDATLRVEVVETDMEDVGQD